MKIVLVGAGLAAQRCCQALRRRGHDGPITLLGDEGVLPYDRPPLSKERLAGSDGRRRADAAPAPPGTTSTASSCASATRPSRSSRGAVRTRERGRAPLRPRADRHRRAAAARCPGTERFANVHTLRTRARRRRARRAGCARARGC